MFLCYSIDRSCFKKCLGMFKKVGFKSGVLYKYRKNAKNKDFRWPSGHDNKGGKPRIWQPENMEKWKEDLFMGQNFSKDDVSKQLTKLNGDNTPCDNTVKIYFEELVQDPDQPCRKRTKVYHKTEKRCPCVCAIHMHDIYIYMCALYICMVCIYM